MGEWIKYDGTNKPDDGVLVEIKEECGWESNWYREAQEWTWCPEENGAKVTHFRIKGTTNDRHSQP